MKGFVAFFIVLSILCIIFSGCNGTDNISDTDTEILTQPVLPALPAAITDENYNKLQTITVFGETAPSGSGIPTLEPKDGTSSMPSIMIESSMMSVLLRD